ncbi:MAG: alpha-hydroxy-acid oxidizing protein [Actinomycetota bacterium]|nr:alpha-hydroxy-acid oxidizing protein [Actinomycetota bacterium]
MSQTVNRSELEARYISGEAPWPVAPIDWETAARDVLEQRAFDYIAGGAADGTTVQTNHEALRRWRLRPRVLTGNLEHDLSVEVLGTRSPLPFFIAPVGVLRLAHEDREHAVARAAAARGIPMIVSTCASTSMEDIAEALGDTPRWYQLYWVSDREVTESFVRRAEAAGYGAIVVTVDTLGLGWRDRDIVNNYLPFLEGDGIAQFTSDPVFRTRLSEPPEANVEAAGLMMVSIFPNLGLAWRDLAWLRELTSLPLLLKGVLRADDARLAIEAGIDGIIVSNHGGRQVDGAQAPIDGLPEVRKALGEGVPVLMDSGIRRASDIFKALALGADAVLLGRPYVYGLAVGGEAGVAQVLRSLEGELDVTASLLGIRNVGELDRSFVTAAGP